jgi:hypothetical protein
VLYVKLYCMIIAFLIMDYWQYSYREKIAEFFHNLS